MMMMMMTIPMKYDEFICMTGLTAAMRLVATIAVATRYV